MSADTETHTSIQNQLNMIELIGICMRMQRLELRQLRAIFVGDPPHTKKSSANGTRGSTTLSVARNGAEENFDAFLDGNCELPSTQIHYIIKIPLFPNRSAEPPQQPQHLDVHVTLPHLYPRLQMPDVSVLSTALANDVLRRMRLDVEQHMAALMQQAARTFVFDVVEWLQTNAGNYASRFDAMRCAAATAGQFGALAPAAYPRPMERLWIRTSLLRCHSMRQAAVRLAKRLRLGGWQRPGLPGFLCVEGGRQQTQEFWKEVRQWHWLKIAVRRTDSKWVADDEEAQQFRRFRGPYRDLDLGNVALSSDGSGALTAVNSNGLFVKFLEQHNCGDAKVQLFRLGGTN